MSRILLTFKSNFRVLNLRDKVDKKSIIFYLLMAGYFIIESLFNYFQTGFITILDVLVNVVLLTYLYYYLNQQKKPFFLLFFFIKYMHILFADPWSLSQFSSFFDHNSLIINIGLLLKLDLTFLNFIFSFLAGFLDVFIFLAYLKFGKFLISKLNTNVLFTNNFHSLISYNYTSIISTVSKRNLLGKIRFITLLIIILVTPVAYTESMQTIHETNDGLFYLTNALSVLLNFFQKKNAITEIISTGNDYLALKNTLYFSAKDLRLSAEHLKSLDSPLYSPFLFLIGANGKVDNFIMIINKLSDFIGGSVLDLVGSIQDYLNLMYQLTHEILRRAYWWELEKYNITYNPKRDFYDKFNTKISLTLINNVQNFKDQYRSIGSDINNSFLRDTSITNTFFSQMTKINKLFDQIIYLSKVAPPLLNATFFSVEVTNALAFDQFITARNLTNLSQKYITQAQSLLSNYTFEIGLSSAISDIGNVMKDFNTINDNFVNMTQNTENMFLSMAKLVNKLNSTTFSNENYLQNEQSLNNDIKISITHVKQIVDDNINKITGFVDENGNYIRFQFQDILKHFLWFYDGYKSAVNGYQNLWYSTNNTLDIFSSLENQQNNTLSLINSYRNKSEIPNFQFSDYQDLFLNYTHIQNYVYNTGITFNASVTDGALRVNKTMWENLLGFNTTTNKLIDTGFNKYIKSFFDFWYSTLYSLDFSTYYNTFDNFVNTSNTLLQNLSAVHIFLSQSEQLPNS